MLSLQTFIFFLLCNSMPKADPFVFTKKTVFMQRVADQVRAGHQRYVQGSCSLAKVADLHQKLARFHHLNLPRMEASRTRKGGSSTARLLFWLPNTESVESTLGGDVFWVLLTTEGEPPIPNNERWRDPLTDRIEVLGYELVRHTRAGSRSPSWSWRYTPKAYKELRDSLVHAIRHREDWTMREKIQRIAKTPGFALAREQCKKLLELIRGEWKRHRGADEVLPELPVRFGYVRRLPDVGQRHSALMRAAEGRAVAGLKGVAEVAAIDLL